MLPRTPARKEEASFLRNYFPLGEVDSKALRAAGCGFVRSDLFHWDPLQFECPSCSLDGRMCHWVRKGYVTREVIDLKSNILLVGHCYLCKTHNKSFSSFAKPFVSSPLFRENFFKSKEKGCTTSVLRLMANLIPYGTSFRRTLLILKEERKGQYAQYVARFRCSFSEKKSEPGSLAQYYKQIPKTTTTTTTDITDTSAEGKLPLPITPAEEKLPRPITSFPLLSTPTSHQFLIDLWLKNFKKNELILEERMQRLSGTSLSVDHTFKVAFNISIRCPVRPQAVDKKKKKKTKTVKQYDSMFICLNEKGMVVTWALAKTCGLQEMEPVLKRFLQRPSQKGDVHFISDRCCQDLQILHSLGIHHIRLDLFHATRRLTSCISTKTSCNKAPMLEDMRNVFRQADDHKKIRKKPTPERTIMRNNLVKWFAKWRKVWFFTSA